MMRVASCFVMATALVALPAEARAESKADADADAGTKSKPKSLAREDSDTIPGALVVGAKIGPMFPQPFSALRTHVAVGVEFGYRMPFVGQRFEAMFQMGFSPPNNKFTIDREEGPYEAMVDTRQLHFSLGPRFRVMDRSSPWNLTAAIGPRLFLLRTFSNGSRDGQDFAEFTEQSTRIGVFAAIGFEYALGPGAIFLDFGLGWSPMPHTITGDVSTGNLDLLVGYRFFLL